jgi:hypothetical protein
MTSNNLSFPTPFDTIIIPSDMKHIIKWIIFTNTTHSSVIFELISQYYNDDINQDCINAFFTNTISNNLNSDVSQIV